MIGHRSDNVRPVLISHPAETCLFQTFVRQFFLSKFENILFFFIPKLINQELKIIC